MEIAVFRGQNGWKLTIVYDAVKIRVTFQIGKKKKKDKLSINIGYLFGGRETQLDPYLVPNIKISYLSSVLKK